MKNSPIRIAAFGHRGVGKSTYLTALYMMLVNNSYDGVSFDYTDDDTAAKLSEYLNTVTQSYVETSDWQLPPTVAMPQQIQITLHRRGQTYPLTLIDYRGEATTIGEMTQNKEMLDFFASCDGLMIFNANESDETDFIARRVNHLARHQDLKYLFDQLKKRSGQARLQIPVAMVYTKSDKIDFEGMSPEQWVENRNHSLLETLAAGVQDFQTVFVSSQMAFSNVLTNDRFKISESMRADKVIKSDADVAQPLFWLLDRIRPPQPVLFVEQTPQKLSTWKWLAAAAAVLAIVAGIFFFKENKQQAATAGLTPSNLPNGNAPAPVVYQNQPPAPSVASPDQSTTSGFNPDFEAVISDPDGFTNIRAAENADAAIVGKMLVGEPFEVRKTNSNWWQVRGKESGIEGFMHKSRIRQQSPGASQPGQYLTGKIGQYPVRVYLEDGAAHDCPNGGSQIVGYYFYENNRSNNRNKIRLRGYNCGASLHLSEFDPQDREIAIFVGMIDGSNCSGRWSGLGKELEFSLSEMGSSSSQNRSSGTHAVLPARSHFHDFANGVYTPRRNVFVVRGDQVTVLSSNDAFFYSEYVHPVSGTVTRGFLLQSELQAR